MASLANSFIKILVMLKITHLVREGANVALCRPFLLVVDVGGAGDSSVVLCFFIGKSSVVRQRLEYKNSDNKKIKNAEISTKLVFLTH